MPKPHYRPINYIKVSLLWAFYYLKNGYTFERAMKDVIAKKGDTDVNAAIIGGLLGAANGIEGIPHELIERVMRLDVNRGIYTPKNSLANLFMIAVESPSELKVSWKEQIFEGNDGLQACNEKFNAI
jgi:hypothetical protein